MTASAPDLVRAVRGASAARALLAQLDPDRIQKAPDPLHPAGFDALVRQLAVKLLGPLHGPSAAAQTKLRDLLSVRWDRLGARQRERVLAQAETLIGEVGRKVAPDLAKLLGTAGTKLLTASRAATIGRWELPIAASLSGGPDEKAIAHLAGAHELFFTDQYGRVASAFGASARKVVTEGLEQGLDYQAIGADLEQTVGAALGRGRSYCTLVASVFVARARSASMIQSFDEAGIERYQLSAVIDEVTCFAHWTRVLLGDGKTWVPIHKLRAGDVVMSCRGRPRPVVKPLRSKARTWGSLTVRGARRPLQVTQSHGILTPAGWVRAHHLEQDGRPGRAAARPVTRVALYRPELAARCSPARLWSDERTWGMRSGRIDPHTVDTDPYPAPDLAHLPRDLFGELVEVAWDTLGQTPTSCADAFDLEVDEDHGYVAEGVIVHNSNICRALDGKIFTVAGAIDRLEQVARAESPTAIKDLQPFVQDGVDEDGHAILYTGRGAERMTLAHVEEDARGKKDERGSFRGLPKEAALEGQGISMPPFHGYCRTLAVPVMGGSSGGGGEESPPARVQVPEQIAPAKPTPKAPSKAFEDLPVGTFPEKKLPPGGREAWKETVARRVEGLTSPQIEAVQRYTNGFDWTIREIDKGALSDAEIAAAYEKRFAGDFDPARNGTAADHVAKARAYAKELAGIFEAAEPTPAKVYRGLYGLSREQIDGFLTSPTLEMNAVASTSWNPEIAQMFLNPEDTTAGYSVFLQLEQQSGVAIETLSEMDTEREILVRKGTTFEITKYERATLDDGKNVLILHAKEAMKKKHRTPPSGPSLMKAKTPAAPLPGEKVVQLDGHPVRPGRFAEGGDEVHVDPKKGVVRI